MINPVYSESIGLFKFVIFLFSSLTSSILAVRWHKNRQDRGVMKCTLARKVDMTAEKIVSIEQTALMMFVFVKYGILSSLFLGICFVGVDAFFISMSLIYVRGVVYSSNLLFSITLMISAVFAQILYMFFL